MDIKAYGISDGSITLHHPLELPGTSQSQKMVK